MRLENLVTCVNVVEWRESRLAGSLPSLLGVFQELPFVPHEFAVFAGLRPGADDDVPVRLRCRQRRKVWFESDEWIIRFGDAPSRHELAWVHDCSPPVGRSVVEMLTGSSVLGACLIDLGHEQ